MINVKTYFAGNQFKINFRKHYCYKCGSKLSIIKLQKVVSQKSKEAKYYDFSFDDGTMIGPCKFIHKAFNCRNCSQIIECVTQLNQEDIDIIIKKVQDYFDDIGTKITIKKYFENKNKELVDVNFDFESVANLCLVIEQKNNTLFYRVPLSRKEKWERPYYFKVKKRELIKYIKKNLNDL